MDDKIKVLLDFINMTYSDNFGDVSINDIEEIAHHSSGTHVFIDGDEYYIFTSDELKEDFKQEIDFDLAEEEKAFISALENNDCDVFSYAIKNNFIDFDKIRDFVITLGCHRYFKFKEYDMHKHKGFYIREM